MSSDDSALAAPLADSTSAMPGAPRDTRRPLGIRRLLLLQTTALLSQVLGAGVVVILLREATGRSADAYFLLYGAGQLVVSLWLIGVVYPRRLSTGNDEAWARTASVSSIGASVCVGAATGYAALVGYPLSVLATIAPMLAVASSALAITTTWAVAAACHGRPYALSSTTLLASALALLTWLAIQPRTSRDTVAWVVGATMVANLVSAAAGYLYGKRLTTTVITRSLPMARGESWLLIGSAVGTLSPMALQAATAALPAGELTRLGATIRVGSAVAAIMVTSVLPAFVNWHHYWEAALQRLILIAAGSGVASAWLVGMAFISWSSPTEWLTPEIAVTVLLWVSHATVTSIGTQMAVGRGTLFVFRDSAVANILVTAIGIAVVLSRSSLAAAIASLLAVHAIVNAVLLLRLRLSAHAAVLAMTIVPLLLLSIAGTTPFAVSGAAVIALAGTHLRRAARRTD